jgi:hypothetical protein
VKLGYSSLAAFLAHYRILRRAAQLTGDERERLAEMTKLIEALTPNDRDAIESGAAERQFERALRNLHRLLVERGVLSG